MASIEVREELKKLLGRDVGVEKLRTGKYIAKYVCYGTSHLSLVADTENEAYLKLFEHLQNKNTSDT